MPPDAPGYYWDTHAKRAQAVDKRLGARYVWFMSRLSKQAVRGPDAFVSWADKAAAFIEKNRRQLLVAVVSVLGASLLWMGKQYYDQGQEQKAQAAFYQVQKQYNQLREQAKKDKEQQQTEAEKKTASLFGDTKLVVPLKAELEQAWQTFIQKWPRSQAAHQAAIELADYYTQNKQYESALKVLQSQHERLRKGSFFYGLLHLYTGGVFMQLENWAAAVDEFKLVLVSDRYQHLHPAVRYRMAVCYEKQGQRQEAERIYKVLAADESLAFVATQAKAQLRWLAFQDQQQKK